MNIEEKNSPVAPVRDERPKPVKTVRRIAPAVRRSRWASGGPSNYEPGPKTFGPFKQVRD